MRIIMVTNAIAPDKLGGLERYVGELSGRLAALGHDVSAVVKETEPGQAERSVTDGGVNVLRYSLPKKSDPLFAAKYPVAVWRGVSRAFESLRVDPSGSMTNTVIHGHFVPPMLPLARRGLPFVYTFHAPLHKEVLGERQGSYVLPTVLHRAVLGGVARAERYVLESAAEITTLSSFMRDEQRSLTRQSVPHRLIPGGLDTQSFRPAEWASPPRAVGGGPLVVTARRLVHRTGVENLVEAMAVVVERHPDAQLVVLGDGPRRAAIAEFVDTHGLADNVHLLGRVSDEELLRWYQCAALAVTPTLELEGFGLATAEAMSCGTPALVTPVGANPEVVDGLGSDYVADGNTPNDIARALSNLLDQGGLLNGSRAVARSLVEPRFSWDAVVEQFVDLYERQLVRQGDPSHGRR